MAKKKDEHLKVLPPQAETDETSPLLADSSQVTDGHTPEGLEAQAEREQREHDAGATVFAEEPPTRKLIVIMGSLWLSTFFAALDSTIVATLSGPITASLNSGTLFAWTASGYLIANAAFQPLSGKLTDIYGRRAGLVFATIFFSAGTLMCGLAPSGVVLIIGRIVAGSGGGCLNTVSTFVGSDLVPLRKRGVWQGIGNIGE